MTQPLLPSEKACVLALRILTKDKFCSVQEMLNTTGIARRTWQEVCSRDRYPHLDFLAKFCRGLDISIIEYLVFATELDGLEITRKVKSVSKLSVDALRMIERYNQLTKRQRVAIKAMTDEQFDLLLRIQSIPEDKQKAVFAFLHAT